MANDLQDLLDTVIMPLALPVLRENTRMPALVNRDYDAEAAEQNQTIRVPLPQDLGDAQDMNPATGSTSTDLADPKVDITLDNWKYKQFQMTDKEMRETVTGGVLPSAAESAVKALANNINLALLNLYKDIPSHSGTAGTTPTTAADIIAARKVAQRNLFPQDQRRMVIDLEAEANFLDVFKKVNETGDTNALRMASLGTLFGLESFADQLVPAHTAGTMNDATALINGAVAAGATSVAIDGAGASETLLTGDILEFAGVTDAVGNAIPFVVTADATADGGGAFASVSISPAVPTGGIADNAAVTKYDSHTPNLVFHRNAFCLAMRTLSDEMSENSTISAQQDPISGIPLRLETWREPGKATRYWRFDILYGVKTLRQELAVRMFG